MTVRKRFIAGHFTIWALAMALLLTPLIKFGVTQPVPYVATAYVLYLGSFYINLYLILPWWIQRRQISRLLLAWLLLISLYTLLFLLVNYLFNVYQYQRPRLIVLNTFTRSFLFTGAFLLASTVYRFTVDWFKNERTREEREKEHLKTELSFLRSQVNPHFLFNTLSNIYTLAYQQSDKTADAVMKLSEMMQYMLYESNAESVPLEKELNYIDRFIALEALRRKNGLALDFQVTGEPGTYRLPPLLLIPFVENIFKHGITSDLTNKAVIHLSILKDILHFRTQNSINNYQKDESRGIGLANVKRRLALIYPRHSDLHIRNTGNQFIVELTLQLD